MEKLSKEKESKTSEVVVEKLLPHSVSKVWKALTNREQMQQWYFSLDDFKLEKGFQFKFAGKGRKGEQYTHICRITEIVPEKKLEYSWEYEGIEGYSLVTFELFEIEGNKTKLLLTHRGLETFPTDNADFAPESFNQGWNHLTGISLPEFLDKSNP